MSELNDMLSGILSDPEQMKKISALASSLMGSQEQPQAAQKPPEGEKESSDLPLDEMMGMAKKLFGSGGLNALTGAGAGASGLGSLLGGGGKDGIGGKAAVLAAMRPWMSEKRAGKLERAIKLASVMKVALAFFKNSEGLL